MRKLDVVIPHLNYEHLDECLETLRRLTPEDVLGKVILIDQNPVYKDYGKLVDIHLRTDNLGFAKACNTGIRLSDSEYVMCCNDDVRFINKKWWKGIEDAFKRYPVALFISPHSIRDPDQNRGSEVYTMEGMEKYEHEDMPDEVYDTLLSDFMYHGGICFYAPIFKRENLDKLVGSVLGKAWFNEAFRYGGGEDYAMQWHAGRSGFMTIATAQSWIMHRWHQTKHPLTGEIGTKYDGDTWFGVYSLKDEEGNILDTPDVMGTAGRKDVPTVTIRD